MKRSSFLLCATALSLFNAVGCDSPSSEPTPTTTSSEANAEPKTAKAEPDYITVQHCLIAFNGTLPGKRINRSKEEAKELATKLLAEVKAGADFNEIIRKNTDDSPPGIYKMANRGKKFDENQGVFSRDRMVPAFGDTGFPLEVGEFGLAEYDAEKSPFGWHIVKRTE